MGKNTFEAMFGSDPEKSVDGVAIPMGYNEKEQEVTLCIAEINNKKHIAAQRRYSKLLESTRRNEKRHEAVLAKVVAEGILVKWKGVLDEGGKPIEDTNENKAKYLVKYPKLFQAVMEQAMNQDNYSSSDEASEEDTEKN